MKEKEKEKARSSHVPKKMILLNIVVPLLLIVLIGVFARLHQAGLDRVGEPYPRRILGFESCIPLYSEAIGAEDAAVLSHHPPQILLSAAPHRTLVESKVAEGGIYLLSLNENQAHSVQRVPLRDFQGIFHPHGISIYHSQSGKTFLYVVNHQNPGMPDQILIFEYKNQELVWIETVVDSKLISLNDVVATGEREFFATNDHGTPRDSLYHIIETLYSGYAQASVVYWDGSNVEFVIEPGKYAFANGITQSEDGTMIYLAVSDPGDLIIFKRKEKGQLEHQFTVHLGTGADNLDVDEEGNVWIACHPNFVRFIIHVLIPSMPSPSQVMKVNLNTSPVQVKEIFLSNGDDQNDINASSTAIFTNNFMVITPVFDDHVLVCSKSQ